MANQFGNYLCQKIIEVSSPNELSLIVDSILSQATTISLSVHGTRAMQTLVEVLAVHIDSMESHCRLMIEELDRNILQLSTHVNGNHVI
jgi:pumilio RNA-binding family